MESLRAKQRLLPSATSMSQALIVLAATIRNDEHAGDAHGGVDQKSDAADRIQQRPAAPGDIAQAGRARLGDGPPARTTRPPVGITAIAASSSRLIPERSARRLARA